MKQRTWPYRSDGAHYIAFPFHGNKDSENNSFAKLPNPMTRQVRFSSTQSPSPSSPSDHRDFSMLPSDVLTKITANFNLSTLRTASLVCKSWRDALAPLREAMLFLKWGKRFKHGRGGVNPNLHKALDSFLKGVARGSTLAMVEAGRVFCALGKEEDGIALYRRAAELGDPVGQWNLGISYLQAETSKSNEAVKWLYQASVAGYVRAQYQLALCLHQGRGVDRNLPEAARWYLRAAEGGYVRAMYSTSLCYSIGDGLMQSHRQARKWMKRAADRGYSKAQFEHGVGLFSGVVLKLMESLIRQLGQEGEMMKAVVYLELATRAGETAAAHVKNVILQRLSTAS